jgi:hypothetical protein
MRAVGSSCARASLVLALVIGAGACSDDDPSKNASDDAKDADSGAPGRERSGSGQNDEGDGTDQDRAAERPGFLDEASCRLGAQRLAQAPEQCLDCVCETVANCSGACQDLLVCVLANCANVLSDGVSVVACSLQNCAAEAGSRGAAEGLAGALGGLAACGGVCRVEPEPGATLPADSIDAGSAESELDAGP